MARTYGLPAATFACLGLVLGGCSLERGPDIEAAREFERYPIYWLGPTFEGRKLEAIDGLDYKAAAVVLIYGDCTPSGGWEPSCAPPVQVQIFPLCYHLDSVALPSAGRSRTIRGAPVGIQDSAPVLLTRRTQIKVYRGEGTDPGIGRRALAALRSLNAVEPVISSTTMIPPPARGVLEGDRPCTG